MTAVESGGDVAESELEVLEYISNDVSRLLTPSTVQWEDLRVLGDSVSFNRVCFSLSAVELKECDFSIPLIRSLPSCHVTKTDES